MKFSKINSVFFSPFGGTKKISGIICSAFETEAVSFDIFAKPSIREINIPSQEILLTCIPVYAGRVPAVCAERLTKFKGSKTPAFIVAVYGNRHFDDALLELKNQLTQQGFVVMGAIAAIAKHSIFPKVANQRPDALDTAALNGFVNRFKEYLFSLDNIEAAKPLALPGNYPYKQSGAIALKPSANKACVKCGKCAAVCPAVAIPKQAPNITDNAKCISCAGCIEICPAHARAFRGLKYKLASFIFGRKFSLRREPEIFLPNI